MRARVEFDFFGKPHLSLGRVMNHRTKEEIQFFKRIVAHMRSLGSFMQLYPVLGAPGFEFCLENVRIECDPSAFDPYGPWHLNKYGVMSVWIECEDHRKAVALARALADEFRNAVVQFDFSTQLIYDIL